MLTEEQVEKFSKMIPLPIAHAMGKMISNDKIEDELIMVVTFVMLENEFNKSEIKELKKDIEALRKAHEFFANDCISTLLE